MRRAPTDVIEALKKEPGIPSDAII